MRCGLLAVLCFALLGCTADFDRFKLGVGDPEPPNRPTPSDDDGTPPGDANSSGDGDTTGDGGSTGDGDGGNIATPGDASMPDAMTTMPDECLGDVDCKNDLICERGQCVIPPPECNVDADCAEGLVCIDMHCVFVPPVRLPSSTVQTAGGGTTAGGGLRLHLRIGSPSPQGRMQTGSNRLTLGPFAGAK